MSGPKFWDRLQAAEAKVVARVRSLIFVIAGNGALFADQLANAAGAPGLAKPIKIAAVLCGGLALLLRAGDKNVDKAAAP